MTNDEARHHYRTLLNTLRKERRMRESVLSEPRRSQAINEIDAALSSLTALGQIVNTAIDAGLLEPDIEQIALFDTNRTTNQ